ncbi:MAG TPA: hypothetical protein VKU00_07245 [Chthonomonadaceae bacterium]|nr:hypothetical protein [Chthonomonadaceae bacterium]
MPEEPILEEYICEEHKGELTLLHPDLACLYMPLQSNLETKSG